MDDWRNGGFGIYIHWPFCQSKCPYCDFNSHVRKEIDQARWRKALIRELQSSSLGIESREVETVFFGGGTPSLMEPETVAAVIEEIDKIWGLRDDAEITLEANPTSVEMSRFAGYASAGVNRISIGIQAMNDPDLRRLGRLHSVAEARHAFDIARKLFDRVTFDLIYARQDQTLASWRSELTEACEMAADHLSLYQLTIEQGTRFGELHAKGRLKGLPEDDLAADMYELTQEICESYGMPAYEISNHSKPGSQGRHNLIYWRYGDYLGVGPGAHGRITRGGKRFATVSERMPEKWLQKIDTEGTGVISSTSVSVADQGEEYLLMGLRLREGVDILRLNSLGLFLNESKVHDMVGYGLLERSNSKIMATNKGRIVLNHVLGELVS